MKAGRQTFVRGAICGIASAALFAASAPISKLFLPSIPPLLLAGLLYVGAGIGTTVVIETRRLMGAASSSKRLTRADLPLIAGVVVSGGIVGPVLMLTGLRAVSGTVGSLLLNLEAPLTMLVAVLFFGESLKRREVAASGLIFAAGVVLTSVTLASTTSLYGAAAVAAACASWALDNNLTRRLSFRDPLALVRVKTLAAGTTNLLLATAMGMRPTWRLVPAVLVLGFVSYGLSVLLDVYALRFLGAAREAAFFATAPFLGAAIAVPLLAERLSPGQWAAAATMAAGVAILFHSSADP